MFHYGYQQNQLTSIHLVQEATKTVLVLTETGWVTLSARRKTPKLVMFYRMQNN